MFFVVDKPSIEYPVSRNFQPKLHLRKKKNNGVNPV
jgi:hypothetical protein